MFWVNDLAIDVWQCKTHHGMRGGGFQYSNTAIETALMMEGTFSMPLPALQVFFELAFKPMGVTLI
ncbi:hypothetical protein GYX25_10825 [Gilliamella sp. ESL0254]|nr:hypothetical protein [Gilliamella sp. ESL0254]